MNARSQVSALLQLIVSSLAVCIPLAMYNWCVCRWPCQPSSCMLSRLGLMCSALDLSSFGFPGSLHVQGLDVPCVCFRFGTTSCAAYCEFDGGIFEYHVHLGGVVATVLVRVVHK